MSTSEPSFHVLVLVLFTLCTTAGVNGCSVTPSSAAVVAGDDLSLTCTTKDTSQYVLFWRLGSDFNSAPLLYQSPISNIGVNRIVANGYLVNDSNRNIQVILTLVKASTFQANNYYCICTKSESDFAYVSVLASVPTFYDAMGIAEGKPINLTCSVSFNGAANTSITIKNSTGGSSKSDYDGTSKGLHNVSLDYEAIAVSSVHQNYFCDINLKSIDTSTAVLYSRSLRASIQWRSVRNVQVNPVDRTQCSDGKECRINQIVRCTAEGNPWPVTFQWLTSVNGGVFTMTETSYQFTFTATGLYEVKCIAFNQINGTRYNDSSSVFKTQVTKPLEKAHDQVDNTTTSGEQRSKPEVLFPVMIIATVTGIIWVFRCTYDTRDEVTSQWMGSSCFI